MDNYFEKIIRHFLETDIGTLSEKTIWKVRRSLANYVRQAVYASNTGCCEGIHSFYASMRHADRIPGVWGSLKEGETVDPDRYVPADAAFINACMVSNLELDDSTRGSVHPGTYVWSRLLAETLIRPVSEEYLMKCALFAYELVTRAAMKGERKALELGLHAPGVFGSLGSAAAVSMLLCKGKTEEDSVRIILNALGTAASLMPFCPFTSFIEGSDTKDLYGGWGTYLGVVAAKGAASGLTGPLNVLEGPKSMEELFSSDAGEDIPLGEPYMADLLSIKEFPACFSVNPAANAALELIRKHPVSIEDIDAVLIESYPYSVEIDPGDSTLNGTSARLSLAYAVYACLQKGELTMEDYSGTGSEDGGFKRFFERATVRAWGETGPSAERKARVTVTTKDGATFEETYSAGNVAGGNRKELTDETIIRKVKDLTSPFIGSLEAKKLFSTVMGYDREDLRSVILILLRSHDWK